MELERNPPEPYTIPHVPPPGSAENPHVVACRLPGGNLCTCPVPECSAENVRSSLAKQLHVPLELLAGHALLMHAATLELWDERKPLPPTFFKPARRHRRWITPYLQLRRVRTPAHHATANASGTPYLLALLDSNQILDDLRAGNLPLELLLATSPASLLDVSALALHLSIGSSDPTIHATWLLSRTLPTLLPSLLPALRDHHTPLLLRHKQLSSRLDAFELEAEARDDAYRNVPYSPRLYCSGPRHSTRGLWGGIIGTTPDLAARTALIETTRMALQASFDIPKAADDASHSGGTSQGGGGGGARTRVDFSACQLFAGVQIGRTAYSLAIGPLGLVLLKPPRRQRLHEAAVAAVAAASSSSHADVQPVPLPPPQQQPPPQQPPPPLSSLTSATSTTSTTRGGADTGGDASSGAGTGIIGAGIGAGATAAAVDASLLDGLCALIPWEAVLGVQAASSRSTGVLVSSAAAATLRQLHGGTIGASRRRRGGRSLQLSSAQAPLIACVLQAHRQAHERSATVASESATLSSPAAAPRPQQGQAAASANRKSRPGTVSGTLPVVQQPQVPAMADEPGAEAPAVLITRI